MALGLAVPNLGRRDPNRKWDWYIQGIQYGIFKFVVEFGMIIVVESWYGGTSSERSRRLRNEGWSATPEGPGPVEPQCLGYCCEMDPSSDRHFTPGIK